jgi:hypothetical protein
MARIGIKDSKNEVETSRQLSSSLTKDSSRILPILGNGGQQELKQ